jgi:hypothetical protein
MKTKKSLTNSKSAQAAAAAIAGSTVTMKPKNGQKPISFHAGGLHSSTGTPQGQKIPASKMKKALSGGFGTKAEKQANFKRNVLTGKK